MAYWWVNLGSTYKYEVKGFMWSPTRTATGRSQHYDNMTLIEPGDVIFAHARSHIRAVGIAVAKAQPSRKPFFGNAGQHWSEDGWLVEVQFQELSQPLEIFRHMDALGNLLPEKYSPIRLNGKANQAYLFAVPNEMGVVLVELMNDDFVRLCEQPIRFIDDVESLDDPIEAQLKMRLEISETEKIQLVKSRRGQGLFRTNVRMVEDRCRVTGVSEISMLRASHIKPWRKANDIEKIGGFNGLLLAPHVDHLFDSGLISFEGSGEMLISPKLNIEVLVKWHIPEILNVGRFTADQKEYLEFHNNEEFKHSA